MNKATEKLRDQRIKLIKEIIELQNYFTIEWNKASKMTIKREDLWNPALVDLTPNRFYLVESTTHEGEDFTVKIEVRYSLRSKEAAAYGDKHGAFYKRYLSTVAFSEEDIANPEEYKKEYKKDLDSMYKKETATS